MFLGINEYTKFLAATLDVHETSLRCLHQLSALLSFFLHFPPSPFRDEDTDPTGIPSCHTCLCASVGFLDVV